MPPELFFLGELHCYYSETTSVCVWGEGKNQWLQSCTGAAEPPASRRPPNLGKMKKNHQNVMNGVKVCPFVLILCQDGATGSNSVFIYLPDPKTE